MSARLRWVLFEGNWVRKDCSIWQRLQGWPSLDLQGLQDDAFLDRGPWTNQPRLLDPKAQHVKVQG